MVVGTGLIASVFNGFRDDDAVIIFASGVSNSLEISPTEYARERALLQSQLDLDKEIVYFSTVSVFDKSVQNSPYIEHKLNMERLIESSGVPYYIFRLPIIVGKSSNPHTLTNYLFNCISKGIEFEVHTNACRYLMDVEDVGNHLIPIVRRGDSFITMNVCYNQQLSITEIVTAFETLLNKSANCTAVEKGDCYVVNCERFTDEIGNTPAPDVLSLLRKYYG